MKPRRTLPVSPSITSESWCMRCICPQNESNEITSVPERVPMVIKLGGCGRLDELIDRSAEGAAGGISMQEKCQRCDVCREGASPAHRTAAREGFTRIKKLNTKSNEPLAASECVLNLPRTALIWFGDNLSGKHLLELIGFEKCQDHLIFVGVLWCVFLLLVLTGCGRLISWKTINMFRLVSQSINRCFCMYTIRPKVCRQLAMTAMCGSLLSKTSLNVLFGAGAPPQGLCRASQASVNCYKQAKHQS